MATRTSNAGLLASTFLFYLACDGSQTSLDYFFHLSLCLCGLWWGAIGFVMDVSHGFGGLRLAYFHFYFLCLSLLGLKLIRLEGFCDLVYESVTLRFLHKGWLIEL